jgi:methionyl-tRNA synthetase
MPMRPKFFITTAIDYPNSRPHIGTAFEKIGADVQARYRRMEGYDVFFLMGNDENTVKVAKKAAELGQDVQAYCNDMAAQFRQVWDSLGISYDEFVQTTEPRHHHCCRTFIQKVFDNGYIRKDKFEGWYCNGCEAFKTEQEVKDAGGVCALHAGAPLIRRSEDCYYFEQSKFQDKLLKLYEEHPDFIQPESRRNEIIALVKSGLNDLNITRMGEAWGIRVPWDERFTIYVWFDALLTYITGIGYGSDRAKFDKWWPCDIHFIGKDITRFHCATWPAMLLAAGETPPKMIFGHGFVYKKNEETGAVERFSKSLGNVIEPMDIIARFSGEAFRYYFMRECPFPGDGEFSWARFAEVYNSDLANNLGNLYSRVVTLITKNYDKTLPATAGVAAELAPEQADATEVLTRIRTAVEACEYNAALEVLWRRVLDPANRYADKHEPWKKVKTDKAAAAIVLQNMVEALRRAAIFLKPFTPKIAERIYASFDFPKPWNEVMFADTAAPLPLERPITVVAQLDAAGKVQPMFPRIS